ncbi:MAG: hypothetical protein K9N46_13320 [Candidatus Marinimicrobia bacterium]|nr:hypothetical protein [Candidatus Neomarinimicrobiota bacterium]MCF7829762.1 hypothetical protein [Candidatus Neomarinimicrobiota bacterium]MCF7881712.1 hypothetical protein [Candidatus Neomarinimicrobiota bacterium]
MPISSLLPYGNHSPCCHMEITLVQYVLNNMSLSQENAATPMWPNNELLRGRDLGVSTPARKTTGVSRAECGVYCGMEVRIPFELQMSRDVPWHVSTADRATRGKDLGEFFD